MSKINQYPMVEVYWLDACGCGAEILEYEDLPRPMPQYTIGYLLEDSPECVIVASTRTPDDTRVRDAVAIPRGMVTEVKKLEFKH